MIRSCQKYADPSWWGPLEIRIKGTDNLVFLLESIPTYLQYFEIIHKKLLNAISVPIQTFKWYYNANVKYYSH